MQRQMRAMGTGAFELTAILESYSAAESAGMRTPALYFQRGRCHFQACDFVAARADFHKHIKTASGKVCWSCLWCAVRMPTKAAAIR